MAVHISSSLFEAAVGYASGACEASSGDVSVKANAASVGQHDAGKKCGGTHVSKPVPGTVDCVADAVALF